MRASLRTVASLIALIAVAGVAFVGGRRIANWASAPLGLIRPHPKVSLAGLNGELAAGQAGAAGDPAETFQEVMAYVQSEYVDPISDEKKMRFGAVRSMLVSLDDPQTRFLEPEQRIRMEKQLSGSFVGIGATLAVLRTKRDGVEKRRMTVVAPAPGGPAERAGVRAGDVVTEVDGRWVIAYDPRLDLDRLHLREMTDKAYRQVWRDATKRLVDGISLPRAYDRLTGAPLPPAPPAVPLAGQTDPAPAPAPLTADVPITLERPGVTAPIKVTVHMGPYELSPVTTADLGGGTLYMRVAQFTDAADTAVAAALVREKPRSLVLDLRDNAGGAVAGSRKGALGAALRLLGRLTGGGVVAQLARRGGAIEKLSADKVGTAPPVVVLVNRGTANVAEMVAGALRQRAHAQLVGAHTYGDASLPRLASLQEGAGMTLTTGRLQLADGTPIPSTGLIPDVTVGSGEAPGPQDSVARRAAAIASGR